MEWKDKILIGRLGLLELETASLPLMFTGTEKSGNFGLNGTQPSTKKTWRVRSWVTCREQNMWFFHHAFGRGFRFQLHLYISPQTPRHLRKLPRRWPSYRTHCSAVLELQRKVGNFWPAGIVATGWVAGVCEILETPGRHTAWKTTNIAVISGILKLLGSFCSVWPLLI